MSINDAVKSELQYLNNEITALLIKRDYEGAEKKLIRKRQLLNLQKCNDIIEGKTTEGYGFVSLGDIFTPKKPPTPQKPKPTETVKHENITLDYKKAFLKISHLFKRK